MLSQGGFATEEIATKRRAGLSGSSSSVLTMQLISMRHATGVPDAHTPGDCDGIRGGGRSVQLHAGAPAHGPPGGAAGALDLPAAHHWSRLLPPAGEIFIPILIYLEYHLGPDFKRANLCFDWVCLPMTPFGLAQMNRQRWELNSQSSGCYAMMFAWLGIVLMPVGSALLSEHLVGGWGHSRGFCIIYH